MPHLVNRDPGIKLDVALALGNELTKYGMERMLRASGVVRQLRIYGCVPRCVPDDVDVLVVELREVAGAPHVDAIDELRRCGTKVIALLDSNDADAVMRVARTGADGFIYDDELNVNTLYDALVRVSNGEACVPMRLSHELLTRLRKESGTRRCGPSGVLTARERQVLALLVDGLSNKQIAHRLDSSEHNAKRLVANILAKLNCPNRTLAAAKAIREGFLDEQAGA